MSPEVKSSGSSRFGWVWALVVVAAFLLGRFGWNALHPAPASAPAPVAGAAAGEEATRWVPLADAERQAQQESKPILYDFNAAWCPPCQALKREVFSDPARAKTLEAQVVPVSVVDRYREDGKNAPDVDALQQRFQVYALPTLIVLNPATGKFEKREGYAGADETLQWIAASAAAVSGGATR